MYRQKHKCEKKKMENGEELWKARVINDFSTFERFIEREGAEEKANTRDVVGIRQGISKHRAR